MVSPKPNATRHAKLNHLVYGCELFMMIFLLMRFFKKSTVNKYLRAYPLYLARPSNGLLYPRPNVQIPATGFL